MFRQAQHDNYNVILKRVQDDLANCQAEFISASHQNNNIKKHSRDWMLFLVEINCILDYYIIICLKKFQ